MRELPSGTVSMLFSDIEGSTLLLRRLGAAYTEALDGQRHVLRTAWEAHGGTEMGTEGDSFFVVFPRAEDAVRAAVDGQRALAHYPWPGGEHVRVRMGIHTGTPQVHDDDYVGMDVHRAARIAASAHGEQVVLSSATADLARQAGMPDGVGLKDLGSHHLKDLPAVERIFQLTVPGLREDFPALKSVGTSTSLPSPLTHLVGREESVSELVGLLRTPDVRLVSLVGPGGAGKTRLAVEVARAVATWFADGVHFVPLASVTRHDDMWTAIADVVDAPRRARSPERLLEHVAPHAALYVLDNLEQLDAAAEVVQRLLEASARSAVLATSRRALGLPGEHRWPVPPLALPATADLRAAGHSPAVELFVQQAGSVRPDFHLTADNVEDVVALCRRLDGLPLAIELSAARARLLGPHALLRRVDGALDVAATAHGPDRQRTLRDTIAWSRDLLTPTHQRIFERLGVFAGGADLAAVEAVAVQDASVDALDAVAELADASLVAVTESADGEPRVTLLETIRAFTRDALHASGELDGARATHAAHYVRVAEQLEVLRRTQHERALAAAETELDNFREALTWALGGRDGAPGPQGDEDAADAGATAPRLAAALGWFWYHSGYALEGRRWLDQLVDGRYPDSAALSDCLAGYANLLIAQGEPDRARDLAARGAEMARGVDDDVREAFALGVLGTAQLLGGDLVAARGTFEAGLGLSRRLDDEVRLTRALGNLAGVEEELGNFTRAEELTREALGIVTAAGDSMAMAIQGQNLAHLLALSGRVEEARREAQALVAPVLRLRSPSLTMAFAHTFVTILTALGNPVAAAHLLGAEAAMRERLVQPNPFEQEEQAEAWSAVENSIPREEWERQIDVGRELSLEDLLGNLDRPRR